MRTMQTWLNFWPLVFWICFFSFTICANNFIKILFLSELTWLVLYNYVLLIGSLNDDISMISTAFFILGLAGLEFSLGLLLVIIFKKILKIENFNDSEKNFFDYINYNNKII